MWEAREILCILNAYYNRRRWGGLPPPLRPSSSLEWVNSVPYLTWKTDADKKGEGDQNHLKHPG